MTVIEWEKQIRIDDLDNYIGGIKYEFASHGVRVKLEDQLMVLQFPFQGLSPKKVISLVDTGEIAWQKVRENDANYWFTYYFSMKRAFYLTTFIPFFLILMMLVYNYFNNPYFTWNWTKLAVLGLGNLGWIYFLYLRSKVKNYFSEIFEDEK